MLSELLCERRIPELCLTADEKEWSKRREDLLEMLSENIYGVTPEFDTELYSFIETREEDAYHGKAVQEWVRLSFQTPGGMYSFPFQLIIPKKASGAVPAFLHITFDPAKPQPLRLGLPCVEEMPTEEILDAGYAVANLYYQDVTTDSDRKDGLALAYPENGRKTWGKIGMWAFAASRVMDYLLTRKEVDASRVAVGGWSRLGKTALWCAAQDPRFSLAISTESGCSGASLHRGNVGETIGDITVEFPYWFCPVYREWAGKEDQMPFDQHALLACVAPRGVFIGSAAEDEWADPRSEFLSAFAAGQAYELLGCKGLVTEDRLPEADEQLMEGKIGYMMRSGVHGMSRTDWRAHMEFRRIHGM